MPLARCTFAPPIHPQQGKLSSGYGTRPGRTTGEPRHHAGLDFVAPRGAPVYAMGPSDVAKIVREDAGAYGFNGYGNAVVLRTRIPDYPYWILHAHLDAIGDIEYGEPIEAGHVIGYVGNTSNGRFPGMGVHVHQEWRKPPTEFGYDRESPFPGPYGSFDTNPLPIMAQMGIKIGRRGKIEVQHPACAPKYRPVVA